jgi:NADPH-dependent glutamate synthase beta subunit-like oxidoreductase/ferredoxin/coenzyme F420-reducing hydrogenase delta subunit
LKGLPECSNACPAGVNVKAYVNLIANRRFEEAVDVIRQNNPFPAICGRVCTRPCENSCEQGKEGDPVSVRALKRYATDYELARRSLLMEPCEKIYNEKIAIVGAGPAGLSAAVDLVRIGYPVTVFEGQDEPGGMLRYAIPSYRLPKRILNREIDWIKGLGIKIETGKKIDDPSSLLKKGYSTVLIAGGAPKALPLGIEGENAEGIVDPLMFLQKVNTGHPMDAKGEIVVIGGGSTAFDVARSAIRLGAKKVTLAYRRGYDEMPAEDEEIKDAQEEGLIILTLAIPKKILVKNGKVTGIELLKAKLGEPDESGRKRPVPIKGSEFVLKSDIIIPAIGTKPDVGLIGNIKITNLKDSIDIKEKGYTKIKGIFAAGDVETGPSSVVEAIGRGHEAAIGINEYLRGKDTSSNQIKKIPIVTEALKYDKSIHFPKRLDKKIRSKSFDEVEKSFLDYEAVEEASRCFTCGPCSLCDVCLPNCEHKQLAAKIDEATFLLKVPCDLSEKISKGKTSDIKIINDNITTKIILQSLTAEVDKELCISCGRCEEVCAYRAVKNVFKKDEIPYSTVDHSSCASCSACISVCPTGAISQGYMSDEDILYRLQEKKTAYNGIKALMSYWSTPSHFFENYIGVVEIMSARKPSPSFLIRALARSGKGLLLIGPDEKTGSHYLPWEEHPQEIVEKTQKLLKLFGISPERIKYVGVPNWTNPNTILDDYSKRLDKKGIKELKISLPKSIKSPINEAIIILRILGADQDEKPTDVYFSSSVKSGGVAFFEGCLPILHLIGESHKLYDLGSTRLAIHNLLSKSKINYGSIEGLSCPSKGLFQTNIKGIKDIVLKIAEKNIKSFKKASPKKLILGTPESFTTFSKDKNFKNLSSLVDELFKVLKEYNSFNPINKTIAIHHSCQLEKDPFYETTKKLLKLIPGINIIEIDGKCGHNYFEKFNADTKKNAIAIMKKAEDKGADMILCTSPYCESHLQMCHRKGSWRSINIKVTDVYRLLISSIEGDDI